MRRTCTPPSPGTFLFAFLCLTASSRGPHQQQPATGAQAFLLPLPSSTPPATSTTTTTLYHTPPSSSSSSSTSARPSILSSAPQTSTTTVAADDNVPEGHKGLHNFLYGDDDAHTTTTDSASGVTTTETFTRTQPPMPVPSFLQKYNKDTRLAAVYGVYDTKQQLQYVGLTRNVAVSLQAHLQAQGPEAVASIALQSFRFPKREEMAEVQAAWLTELKAEGVVPEGNQEGAGAWAKSIKEAVEGSARTAEERAAYEENKVKLRTAMADPTLADELDDLDEEDEYGEEAEEDRAFRRAQLKKAVEQNDWSGVIDGQTAATRVPQPGGDASASAAGAVSSPFGAGGASSSQGGDASTKAALPSGEEPLELTPANVDVVLEEVRPYLISDGGNIEVVEVNVQTRDIFLRLQGACGSCPSSTTTMKMGVERVLREKFADLGRIEAVSDEPQAVDEAGVPLTEAAALKKKLEEKLGEILPAIRGLGASATIEDVSEGGVVTLSFKGPDKVKLGVVYALKGTQGVSDVKTV